MNRLQEALTGVLVTPDVRGAAVVTADGLVAASNEQNWPRDMVRDALARAVGAIVAAHTQTRPHTVAHSTPATPEGDARTPERVLVAIYKLHHGDAARGERGK